MTFREDATLTAGTGTLATHEGGCHCGNLRVRVRLTTVAADTPIRSCACSFCRAHGTRTLSDPAGQAVVAVSDISLAQRYRFGSRTADYLLCRGCGVYIGAVCETPSGARAVINTLCLNDRDRFTREAVRTDRDDETAEVRMARREATWMPISVLPAADG
jgi:hypothetical protein